jgi:hypothetical protein
MSELDEQEREAMMGAWKEQRRLRDTSADLKTFENGFKTGRAYRPELGEDERGARHAAQMASIVNSAREGWIWDQAWSAAKDFFARPAPGGVDERQVTEEKTLSRVRKCWEWIARDTGIAQEGLDNDEMVEVRANDLYNMAHAIDALSVSDQPAKGVDEEKLRQGVRLIAAERERQVGEEGWTSEHDDSHDLGELAKAAACYAKEALYPRTESHRRPPRGWPWESSSWKPTGDPIRDLAKAGALIAAEIDRLSRGQRGSTAAMTPEAMVDVLSERALKAEAEVLGYRERGAKVIAEREEAEREARRFEAEVTQLREDLRELRCSQAEPSVSKEQPETNPAPRDITVEIEREGE